MSHTDVIILGGGAAGLMCALQAGRLGLKVRVLEHANRVGKKILMSGGGRCNFTNLGTTPKNFLSANPHFCKSALSRFRPEDFLQMVRAHGIAFHEKELGQLFCNQSSKEIVRMLTQECELAGVEIRVECSLQGVRQLLSGEFEIESTHGRFHAKHLVVATGGLSIPSMGATGIGYELARQFGHTVLPTRAALVPLTLSGRYQDQYAPLSGLSLPVIASVGAQAFENFMLITHRGLSGPAILQISSYWDVGSPNLQINLLPDAQQRFEAARQRAGHLTVAECLADAVPKRFAQCFLQDYPALASRKLAECGKSALAPMLQSLNRWPVQPSGTEGYRTAEVTLGGVDTLELQSNSMMSKRVPNLYFIGEVVDVTGHLGGYNFQWAWASAVAAARAMQVV